MEWEEVVRRDGFQGASLVDQFVEAVRENEGWNYLYSDRQGSPRTGHIGFESPVTGVRLDESGLVVTTATGRVQYIPVQNLEIADDVIAVEKVHTDDEAMAKAFDEVFT